MKRDPARTRRLIVSVLVALAVGLSSGPAMAGKKKAKHANPNVGGLYVPAGPVMRRGIVLESLSQPTVPAALTGSDTTPAFGRSSSELPPETTRSLYRTIAIETLKLRSLFD